MKKMAPNKKKTLLLTLFCVQNIMLPFYQVAFSLFLNHPHRSFLFTIFAFMSLNNTNNNRTMNLCTITYRKIIMKYNDIYCIQLYNQSKYYDTYLYTFSFIPIANCCSTNFILCLLLICFIKRSELSIDFE